jgi:uncharacterized protein (DUF2336 family)
VESLIAELELTLARVSIARRLEMLRQVSDLFFAGASSYGPEQIAIFDAVIERIAKGMHSKALVELSGRLAAMGDTVPAETVVQLCNEDDIAVSGPLLEKSNALQDNDLVGIAKSKSQNHLLAIASRTQINDVITDVLVDRGNIAVKRKVTGNTGASLSENSFARLFSYARKDKALANLVTKRNDIPSELQPFLDMMTA